MEEQLFIEIEKRFNEHLNISDNSRIILSSKFGSGKTTFLKYFFTDKEFTKKGRINYEVFHLFPVNYSISSNQDIIELIKYDITLQLLKKGNRISIYQDNIDTTIPFIKENYDKTIDLALTAFSKIDPTLTLIELPEFIEKLFILKSAFKKFNKESNLKINEGESLAEFLDMISNQTGSLYESNYISQIIQKVLENHKEKNTKEEETLENILILDDLDRIDPEHIFRILNVFGSHFDSKVYESKGLLNKFGFDKVILVCDINNIRKIFSSRYGQDTDFSGYIDKFFSRNVFNFDISLTLKNFFKKELESKHLSIEGNEVYLNYRLGDQNMPFFLELLVLHYRYGNLNMRKIINLPKILKIPDYFFYRRNHYVFQERAIILIILLIKLLGGVQNTLESFKKLNLENVNLRDLLGGFSNELFRIYTRNQHEFSSNEKIDLYYGFKTYDNIRIEQRDLMDLRERVKIRSVRAIDQGIEDIIFENAEIYEFLEDAILFVKQSTLEY